MTRDLTGILDAVLAGIVVLDRDGRLELANTAAARMLEVSPASAHGRQVETLLGPAHALTRVAREVLASGRSATENECPVERRFEPDLAVDISGAPLFDAAGQLDGAVVFLRDATLQRDLQRLVVDREHLSAFGHIAAGVAHEVKNPLGGIRGAAEILGSRAADAKTADTAELIVREVDRIATLLDDLMVFARGDAVQRTPTNIHRVLDEVLELVAHEALGREIAVEREFDPSIPEVLLDRDRITQVFLNLIRNAVQAMDGHGTLTIRTRMRLDRRMTGHAGDAGPTLRVEIHDSGPGIPSELLGQLATPFFTTRSDGTGLGLAVSRHWIAAHDGLLQLTSPEDGGACAQVDLPLRTAS
ncbi:MAG: PAS domain-containing protein [Deltaproteobacteria bacterium]|nr:PAS domain-containing protein [Deltaproteobacteria bacterium]